MKKWIFTGVSGSGRIEFVENIKNELLNRGFNVRSHDLGAVIRDVCKENKIEFDDEKILDIDASTLKLARALAIQKIQTEILKDKNCELHLIGVHLTFKWKGRLIPGFTVKEIIGLQPDGFINVVDDVEDIFTHISENPKWKNVSRPEISEIQYWLMEEEFITEMLGELIDVPVYLIAKKHNITNISDIFVTNKKKVYLSYPITAIKDKNPEILEEIQTTILSRLEELFIVFNPLAIKDMKLTYLKKNENNKSLPEFLEQLDEEAIEIIKTRTVYRDYQFIDQSDAIVVFYMTDKLSPGVMGEMYYAHRNSKPVFVVFNGSKSPFLLDISTVIESQIDNIFKHLERFSKK